MDYMQAARYELPFYGEANGCLRCYEGDYAGGKCSFCGVKESRPVRYIRRRIIGGKYGRNSGTVGTAGKKRGTGH